MSRRHRPYILLALILLLAAGLRLYRLYELAHFNSDQAYAAEFAWMVAKVFPVQLVGQGLSIMGLFMGPWYFYYLVPFFLLTGLHPLGGYLGSVLLGLATILLLFFVARYFFDTRTGLLLAFIQAITPSAITTDWQLTPAYSSILIIPLTWYLLHRYWQGKTGFLPALFFVFGLYTSFHPIQFPFYLVFLILVLLKRHLPSLKIAFFSLFAFLLPTSPLLAFEYFRHFAMAKQLLSLFSSPSNSAASSNLSRLPYFIGLIPRHVLTSFGFPALTPWLLLPLSLLFLAYLIFSRALSRHRCFHLTALPVTLAVFLAYYALFPGNVSEYYYNALFTLAVFYTAALLAHLFRQRFGQVVLILILLNASLVSYFWLQSLWRATNRQNLADKDAIVREIVRRQRQHPTEEFFVSHISLPGSNFGYDYLFRLYGYVPQTRAAIDPIYTIVTPKTLSPGSIDFSSGALGLILPASD